jgi:hypothetical protein
MPFGLGFFATAGAGGAGGTYELIETQILTSSAASITFSSLSSFANTYQHLQIRAVARGLGSGVSDYIGIRFNDDTGANYSWHQIFGSGTVGSGAATSTTAGIVTEIAGSGQTANVFGAGVVDILDAFETTKYKTTRGLSGNPATAVNLWSSSWRNTNAISSITLFEYDGQGNFAIGSRFSLYGLRAS